MTMVEQSNDAMLRDVLADIRTDIREVGRENRESNRHLQEQMEVLHSQVLEMRTRMRIASGIAGLFGGTLVVALTKGLGLLFTRGG